VSQIATSVGLFAVATQRVVLLVCAAIAALVGHLIGRRQQVSITGTLTDMLLIAALVGRIVFVVVWFEHYRDAPWTILDIRDVGFAPWASVSAAIGVALWQGWRCAALRGPLLVSLFAGSLAWGVSSALLRLNTGPALSDLEEISLVNLQGTPQSLAGLAQSKPLVVNLWATWCPPCRREMPVLAQAQQQTPGVAFVFVDQGEVAFTVQKFLNASPVVFANVLLDPGKKLGEQLGAMALPTTLFYDANGRLVDTHVGALSSATLADKLKKLGVPG
jgi:thiol-disulfide isomerase/thioredoxin